MIERGSAHLEGPTALAARSDWVRTVGLSLLVAPEGAPKRSVAVEPSPTNLR
jgi:hypothetical protein